MAGNVSDTPVAVRGPFTFDASKAIQAILYAANRLKQPANIYWVLKSLYFADKHHLHRYGRFIFGDRYVAMRHGPVPSGAYDLCKIARGESPLLQCPEVRSAFSMDGNHVIAFVDANPDVFSGSDLECLDEGIRECRDLSFGELKSKSHDGAWQNSDENDVMTIESIAGLAPDKDVLLEYLQDLHPGRA
ncbi:MAG: SocA family protein [candidate division NC10 bacterium]|nr:SocA family protein [candidate division NC10 bacterium]MBI2114584.1 SocA family protein [candidate division NC10 bacterium]